MKDKIEIGDKVIIRFDNMPPLKDAEVVSIPSATDECWIVKTNTIHYIQHFAYLSLITEEIDAEIRNHIF